MTNTESGFSSPRWLHWLLYCLPGAVLLLFSIHDWWGPDSWYHLFLGRGVWEQKTISPTDSLILKQTGYVNQYWFFQSILYGAYASLGLLGVRLVMVALWAGTFWAWSGFFRDRVSPIVGSALCLFGVVLFQHRMEYRPEVCSYFFSALCLRLTYGWLQQGTWQEKWHWPLFASWCALQWIWSNCHGYFFFGTLLVALAALSELFEKRKQSALRLFGLTVGGALAVLLPPLGWWSWWDFWHLFKFLKAMSNGIEEFLPSYTPLYLRSWTTLFFWVVWTITLALLPVSLRARGSFFRTTVAALALYLSAKHYRNIPLLPLISAPLWTEIVRALVPKAAFKSFLQNPAWKWAPAVPVAACMVLIVTYARGQYQWSRYSESRMRWEPSSISFPVAFRKYLEQFPFEGKLFNEPSDGGYLEFHFPKLKLYADSRFVDVEPVTEYFRAANNAADFDALHKKHAFDGALFWVLRQQQVILHLLRNPEWRLVYYDIHRAFFVNRNSELTRNIPSLPMNLADLSDWRHGDNRARLKQWLLFFSHLGRQSEFEQLFSALEANQIHLVDFGEVAVNNGLRRQDSSLVARGKSMIERSDPRERRIK